MDSKINTEGAARASRSVGFIAAVLPPEGRVGSLPAALPQVALLLFQYAPAVRCFTETRRGKRLFPGVFQIPQPRWMLSVGAAGGGMGQEGGCWPGAAAAGGKEGCAGGAEGAKGENANLAFFTKILHFFQSYLTFRIRRGEITQATASKKIHEVF